MKKWSVNLPVPMDGTCNFRDLGGYPANGGTIKKGCFYRSDALHRLSEDDLSWMEEKKITTEVALPGNPTIYGNYSLLYSIFRNLYDNAIAYAGEGIHLTVSCYKEDPKFYYFSFSDNGVGVSEEHVNRIFERFYRVDKGRSRKVGGTGLGLSIVKNGVNFHKGQISAKSGLGKGMTFFFTLKKKI